MKVYNIINVLKWDLTINWKQYGWRLVGATGWFLLMMMLLTTSTEGTDDSNWLRGVFILFWILQLTDISSNLDNKIRRIHFLTLPATMTEKLAERMTICLIVWPLTLLASVFIADTLHVILSWALNLPNHSFCSGSLFQTTTDWKLGIQIEHQSESGLAPQQAHINTFALIWLLFNLSYGFMCGCLWTRRALLKSIGLGLALGIGFILITAISLSACGIDDMLELMEESKSEQIAMLVGYIFYWAMTGLLILFTLLFIWIGYHTYTTREVIDFGR